MLQVLAETIEAKDSFMIGHARRTALYAGLLAERLCLSGEEREHIRISAFLHDVGLFCVLSAPFYDVRLLNVLRTPLIRDVTLWPEGLLSITIRGKILLWAYRRPVMFTLGLVNRSL